MKAIYKHELTMYANSFTAYLFAAFLLLFVGIGSLIYNINAAVSNFEYALSFLSIGFVVLVPIITMKVFAEEKKQKTDQLLFSLPVTTADIVLGKYFALVTILGITLVPVVFYPLIFKAYGEVYLPTSYGSLFAFFLLGAAFIAAGMFISSLTESQGLSAAVCVALVVFDYFSVTLSEYVSASTFASLICLIALLLVIALIIWLVTKNGTIAYIFSLLGIIVPGVLYFINTDIYDGIISKIMSTFSLYERFESFINGIFDLGCIVYFLSFAAFFIYLTVQSLEKRRYS